MPGYKLVKTSDCPVIKVNHNAGEKQVLINNGPKCTIPQVAIGHFGSFEKIEKHVHPTMVEYFYFLQGSCTAYINTSTLECSAGDLLVVEAGTEHAFETEVGNVSFLYWGIVEKI